MRAPKQRIRTDTRLLRSSRRRGGTFLPTRALPTDLSQHVQSKAAKHFGLMAGDYCHDVAHANWVTRNEYLSRTAHRADQSIERIVFRRFVVADRLLRVVIVFYSAADRAGLKQKIHEQAQPVLPTAFCQRAGDGRK